MTPAELQDLERLTDWALSRWRERTDYDDLRQEGLVGAWRAWEQCRERGHARSTIVVKAARYAALEWLRSTRSDLPHYGWRRNYAPLELTSVHATQTLKNAAAVERGQAPDLDADLPSPDFTPAVLERLSARQVWVQVIGTATPGQAALLRALYRQGCTRQELAAALGRTGGRVCQMHDETLRAVRERLAETSESGAPDDQ